MPINIFFAGGNARAVAALAALFLPLTAFAAIEYTDSSSRYTDAPFSTSEAAGISLITDYGAAQGNPDGTFAASRTLNRAEFLKIAMSSRTGGMPIQSDDDRNDCFPDVRPGDWFAQFVCHAKSEGIIAGNPDGLFHPERPVNYVEALKMLTLLFGYDVPAQQPGEAWYLRYARSAQQRGTALPIGLDFDASLTRGQMARLAAAFIAEAEGDLANYRRAERGLDPISSSSSSSVASSDSSTSSSTNSSSSSTSTSSDSSDSSVSSVSSHAGFPARSQFLIAGERSPVIASATFFPNLEPVFVRRAEVRLKAEIEGIDTMYVVDSSGVELGTLSLDKIYDSTEKTWRGAFSGNYRIEKSTQKTIGVEIRMKGRNQGGTSEELVQVDRFQLTTEGEWSTNSYTSGTDAGPHPKHQTAMGQITQVTNAQEDSGILPLGPGQQLAAFSVTAFAVEGATLRVENLEFQVAKSSSVLVSNWQLGIPDSNERLNCSYSEVNSSVSCLSLPESLGTLGGSGGGTRTFRLFGDVTLASGATSKDMQISLNLAGNTETNGAVQWTDGSGHFRWVALDQPLARSTIWK